MEQCPACQGTRVIPDFSSGYMHWRVGDGDKPCPCVARDAAEARVRELEDERDRLAAVVDGLAAWDTKYPKSKILPATIERRCWDELNALCEAAHAKGASDAKS